MSCNAKGMFLSKAITVYQQNCAMESAVAQNACITLSNVGQFHRWGGTPPGCKWALKTGAQGGGNLGMFLWRSPGENRSGEVTGCFESKCASWTSFVAFEIIFI